MWVYGRRADGVLAVELGGGQAVLLRSGDGVSPPFDVLSLQHHGVFDPVTLPLATRLQIRRELDCLPTRVWALFDLRDEEAAHQKEWDTRGRKDIGITSQRSGAEAKPNRLVFEQMRRFKDQLGSIKGVSKVSVEPGLGAWKGASEATWITSYNGNGDALRLLAEQGKKYNQDAILIMHHGGDSPVSNLTFDRPVSLHDRQHIGDVLDAHGFGAWVWAKSGGQTVLRSAHIPQWPSPGSSSPVMHVKSMEDVSKALTSQGFKHSLSVAHARIELLERDGPHSYDSVLKRGH